MRATVIATGLLCCGTAWATPTVSVSPSPVVQGEMEVVSIVVKGLPGDGPVQGHVNVGRLVAGTVKGDDVRLRYRPPREAFPRMLCLLLWRDPGQPLVARIPLLARTTLKVTSSPRSEVTLTIDGRIFGPLTSGKEGKLEMEALVPPGVSVGTAQAVGEDGLLTTRAVKIGRPPYNLLTLGVVHPRGPGGPLQVILASGEPLSAPPRVIARGPGNKSRAVPLAVVSWGGWAATWTPPASGAWTLSASAPGRPGPGPSAAVRVKQRVRPLPARSTPALPAPAPSPPSVWSSVDFSVALAAGVMHNTGVLLSPRFSLEVGADYPLWIGRLGLSLQVGLGWGGDELPVAGTTTAARVTLVPVALLLGYRVPLGRFSASAAAGPVVQTVSFKSDGLATGSVRDTAVIPGLLVALGAGVLVGPGEVFFRGGYLHSRLDTENVDMLAGGPMVEVGYRLWF